VLYALCWHAVGALMLTSGAARVLASVGLLTLPLYTALTVLMLVCVVAALWGLVYYLLFLLTGRPRILAAVTLYYAALFLAFAYYLAWSHPVGVTAEAWTLALVFENPPQGSPFFAALAALAVPPVASALAYAGLLMRAQDPTQRYRIALVSSSIAGWFVGILLTTELGLTDRAPWWPVLSRTVELLASVAILLAYMPPGWVRRRYHVAALSDELAQ
jgi:hypothetical protein